MESVTESGIAADLGALSAADSFFIWYNCHDFGTVKGKRLKRYRLYFLSVVIYLQSKRKLRACARMGASSRPIKSGVPPLSGGA